GNVNETFGVVNQTLNPAICGGSCKDIQMIWALFNATNESGVYNVSFQIRDALGQENFTGFSFTVIPTTSLNISGNSTNVSGVQKDADSYKLLNISTNNTDLVNAYSLNLSGMFTRDPSAVDTLANWSFQPIQTIAFLNGSTRNLSTFNITIGQRSLGIYYFTPNATFTQPNGSIEAVWGPNITITVLSNPDFSLSASNSSLALQHGTNQTEWFTITPIGNDNITSYSVSYTSAYSNFSVTFNQTSGSVLLNEIANISMNISAAYGAISGFRNFTVNVTSGGISRNFTANLTIPYNNTWLLSPNLFTIDGISGETHVDNTTAIANIGTGDALLNFAFSLTGNMTSFSNLLNASKGLNTTQAYGIEINFTAPDNNLRYVGYLNVSESNSSTSTIVNITFRSFTVELMVLNISAPAEVIAGDPINETLLLIFGGDNTTSNTTWTMYVNSTPCTLISNTTSGNETLVSCSAPSLADARSYNLTIVANYSTGTSYLVKNTTSASAVFYRDITAPQMIYEISNDTDTATNITLVVNATDNYQIANTTAQITLPNTTIANYTLPYNSTSELFSETFNFTDIGNYLITYITNDTTGNANASLTGNFQIFLLRTFSGQIENLEGSPIPANFSITNVTEGNYDNFSTNGSGYYSKTLRAKTYTVGMKFLFYNVTVSDVNFFTINQSFITLDNFSGSDISSQILGAKAGFGVISEMPSNGTIIIEYATLLASITDESVLRIYQCTNYTFATRTCIQSWSHLTNATLNTISNIISANFSSFANTTHAFALVQYTIPTPTPTTIVIPPSGGSSSSSGSNYYPAPTPLPTPEPKSDNVSAQIEELKKLLQDNKTKETGLETGVQSLIFELYPGEELQSSIHLKNGLNFSSEIEVKLSGSAAPFISVARTKFRLNILHETDLLVFASAPDSAKSGNYFGELQLINEVGKVTIPITVRILEQREERAIDMRLQPLVDSLDPGETLRVEVNLYNMGETKEIKGNLVLELVDPVADIVLERKDPEPVNFETTYNSIKSIKVPSQVRNGRYVVRGIYEYTSGESVKKKELSAITYVKVQASLWSAKLFGMLSVWQFIPLIIVLLASGFTYYRQYTTAKKKRRYVAKVDFTKLPEPGPRAGYLGLIAETKVRAFVPADKLQTHTLIAGATGSGKTVAAQVIVEEALQKNTAVLVFDPTAQWTGYLRPQKNRDMLMSFKKFGMNTDEARAFKGNIYVVRDPNMPIDIKKLMKPGEITVFVMNKLSLADHETFIANTVKQVFAAGLPESPQLKMLCVYDEVHRLLTKFGGHGEGFIQIERGAREFRKWGVGMVLISQVLSDFVGEIKANIGTEIQMRTKYEGDLERLKLKYGEDAARSIVKESIGSGMMQNSEYNNGQPYFVSFRPLLHNVMRLSDTELDQYEKYNNKVESLEQEMERLRESGMDVLDLELEINLARDKVKKGAFNIVEIYIESLDQKILSMKKKRLEKPSGRQDVLDWGIGSIDLPYKKVEKQVEPDKEPEPEKQPEEKKPEPEKGTEPEKAAEEKPSGEKKPPDEKKLDA
ncbi:MAG: DUF87 domain-containing protein, partial [Candidatus Micrarchaeota archaeon]